MDLQMVAPNQKMKLSDSHCDKGESLDVMKFEQLTLKHGYFLSWKPNTKGANLDVEAVDKSNRKCVIELKTRFVNHDKYADYMIEADKLADLLLETKNNDTIPLYVNFFKDDKVAIWNLKKDLTISKKKQRRENTGAECANGEKVMVESTVYYLRLDEATLTTL